jgi:hypothetical protein
VTLRAVTLTLAVVAAGVAASGAAATDPAMRSALAYVDRQCPMATREISSDEWLTGSNFNALFGNCLAGDGRDQHVWFFSGSRYLGSDTREPRSSREIIGLWRDSDTIAFMYVIYRPSDPNCCPTGGGKIVRFRLAGSRLVPLDPLPTNR